MRPECNEYKGMIAKSHIETLTPDERMDLDKHLASCSDCRSEQESYQRTLDRMHSIDDQPIPRHFFIHEEGRKFNPWEVFRLMKTHWQVATTAFACLFVLISVGWAMDLGREELDAAALKKGILQSVEEMNRSTKTAWIDEVRAEINRSRTDLTQRQKAELETVLARLDSRFTQRIRLAESRTKDHTQEMVYTLYNTVARQRAQDLSLTNLRINNIEANSVIKEHQTDTILSTLIQVAELELK